MPILKVGFLFTYLAPLVFVLVVTISKEAYDDFKRYKRDLEANSQEYTVLLPDGAKKVPSSALKCGDLVEITLN